MEKICDLIFITVSFQNYTNIIKAVSYTHLDVYKRQEYDRPEQKSYKRGNRTLWLIVVIVGMQLSLIHIYLYHYEKDKGKIIIKGSWKCFTKL